MHCDPCISTVNLAQVLFLAQFAVCDTSLMHCNGESQDMHKVTGKSKAETRQLFVCVADVAAVSSVDSQAKKSGKRQVLSVDNVWRILAAYSVAEVTAS